MTTRILKYENTSVSANETDVEMDTKSPPSGKSWDVQGIYANTQSAIDYSLVFNERKLFDNIAGDQLPDEDNVLPVNLTVQEGDDLAVLDSETAGGTTDAEFYVVVDEA